MQIVDILQVINSWCCQDLHELTQGKPLIQQHDMVAAQTSSGVCQRRFLLNQMNCFIAAEMTPVLQLVDLYSAKKGKDILEDHKQEIRRMLREECRRENKAVTYKASPLTLMLLMNKIHEGLQDDLQKQDWILHHMRQAGHLAYRPSVERKLLIPTHEYSNQKWLKSHPLVGDILAMSGEMKKATARRPSGRSRIRRHKRLWNVEKGATTSISIKIPSW